MADHAIFDVIRAGDAARLQALVAADRAAVNVRSEKGYSPVLIAQYHRKPDSLAVLLAARPVLDISNTASGGAPARVAELLDSDPARLNAHSAHARVPLDL